MDERTLAEDLPSLYRAILDGVARLEAVGERAEAARIRREATHAYSAAWNDTNRRRLIALVKRVQRGLEARHAEVTLVGLRQPERANPA